MSFCDPCGTTSGLESASSVARRPETDGRLVSKTMDGPDMRITTLGWSLCVSGCWLEHVDMVNPAPLDPAFYEAALKSQGQPGQGGGNAIPFSGDDGPKIMVTGTVKAQQSAAIDVDVRVPDSSEQGGVRQEGKVLMDGPGTFELAVPINQGSCVASLPRFERGWARL